MKLLLIVAMMTVIAFLAGCGGSGDDTARERTSGPTQATATEQSGQLAGAGQARASGGAKGLADPCALVTREDAAAGAGEPVRDAERQDTGNPLGQRLCTYLVERESARGVYVAVVQTEGMSEPLRRAGGSAAKLFADTKSGFNQAGQVQAVTGVGDEAFFGGNQLHVLAGGTYLTILVGSLGGGSLEGSRVVAQRAVAKIGR